MHWNFFPPSMNCHVFCQGASLRKAFFALLTLEFFFTSMDNCMPFQSVSPRETFATLLALEFSFKSIDCHVFYQSASFRKIFAHCSHLEELGFHSLIHSTSKKILVLFTKTTTKQHKN